MAGLPIFSVRDLRISRVGLIFKRAIDLTVCAILAIPLGLIVGILGLLIKLDSPGPIFFAQDRVGKDGKLFKMVKLRSMVVNADSLKAQLQEMNEAEGPIFKIRNDPRLTRMGRITRRLSLDELPQLWNVFTGDMSLVGPRPPLPDEVAEYQEWHRQRLSVTGGITGLWQVSGRSDLTFDEQCLLDIYYIENWTPSFDIRLILQTVPYALFGRGAY
jgi:lipopolysaccharide/colanic/teichoic acid biosynthesis glycosyltransferase